MARNSTNDPGMLDPGGAFETPEEVLKADHLSNEQKRMVLERWRQASGSPVTAEQGSGEDSMATRLARALAFLDSETGERQTTHDQGFYTAVADVDDQKEETGR